MQATTTTPTTVRDSFYNPCCGQATFLGHTEDCANAAPPATRYRYLGARFGETIWACKECGSLVTNHRLHDNFHETKESVR